MQYTHGMILHIFPNNDQIWFLAHSDLHKTLNSPFLPPENAFYFYYKHAFSPHAIHPDCKVKIPTYSVKKLTIYLPMITQSILVANQKIE